VVPLSFPHPCLTAIHRRVLLQVTVILLDPPSPLRITQSGRFLHPQVVGDPRPGRRSGTPSLVRTLPDEPPSPPPRWCSPRSTGCRSDPGSPAGCSASGSRTPSRASAPLSGSPRCKTSSRSIRKREPAPLGSRVQHLSQMDILVTVASVLVSQPVVARPESIAVGPQGRDQVDPLHDRFVPPRQVTTHDHMCRRACPARCRRKPVRLGSAVAGEPPSTRLRDPIRGDSADG
jgi:hypothetical protein